MLRRKKPAERRERLKEEYGRTMDRVKAMLARRAATRVLAIGHREAIEDPVAIARRVNEFLDGGLDEGEMAAASDAALDRNRVRVN